MVASECDWVIQLLSSAGVERPEKYRLEDDWNETK